MPVEPSVPEGRRILRNKNAMLEKDCKRLAQKLQATEAEKDKLTRCMVSAVIAADSDTAHSKVFKGAVHFLTTVCTCQEAKGGRE